MQNMSNLKYAKYEELFTDRCKKPFSVHQLKFCIQSNIFIFIKQIWFPHKFKKTDCIFKNKQKWLQGLFLTLAF